MLASFRAATAWLAAARTRHADALARGLLVALAAVLAVLLLVDPATLLHRFFQSNRPPPDAAYVARKIYQDPATRPLDILILGGSSMREMFPPVGARMEPRGLCAGHDRFLNAATSSQQPADGYAILDALPRAPGLVVIGLTGRRLIGDRRNDPYALQDQSVELPRSRAAAADALRNGRVEFLSMDFFDQLRRSQWTLQTAALTTRGMTWPPNAVMDDRSAYRGRTLPTALKQLKADKLLLASAATAHKRPTALTQYWLDFADHVTARGGRVLFIFTPTADEAAAYASYTRTLTDQTLRSIGAHHPLLDLRGTPLGAADFYDPVHVSQAGRDRLWPQVAAAIRAAQACDAAREVAP